eukprot:TRINITY_DN5385_c0_g1_i1.p1 TRINITY_DN5385_c0_g1~~TRINITY_DN5385_c0_g1_i1.p1  ORF type:complete len:732 (-),score=120.07 TRINITY_DN5385_c0_g1_i1:282-2477(-)
MATRASNGLREALAAEISARRELEREQLVWRRDLYEVERELLRSLEARAWEGERLGREAAVARSAAVADSMQLFLDISVELMEETESGEREFILKMDREWRQDKRLTELIEREALCRSERLREVAKGWKLIDGCWQDLCHARDGEQRLRQAEQLEQVVTAERLRLENMRLEDSRRRERERQQRFAAEQDHIIHAEKGGRAAIEASYREIQDGLIRTWLNMTRKKLIESTLSQQGSSWRQSPAPSDARSRRNSNSSTASPAHSFNSPPSRNGSFFLSPPEVETPRAAHESARAAFRFAEAFGHLFDEETRARALLIQQEQRRRLLWLQQRPLLWNELRAEPAADHPQMVSPVNPAELRFFALERDARQAIETEDRSVREFFEQVWQLATSGATLLFRERRRLMQQQFSALIDWEVQTRDNLVADERELRAALVSMKRAFCSSRASLCASPLDSKPTPINHFRARSVSPPPVAPVAAEPLTPRSPAPVNQLDRIRVTVYPTLRGTLMMEELKDRLDRAAVAGNLPEVLRIVHKIGKEHLLLNNKEHALHCLILVVKLAAQNGYLEEEAHAYATLGDIYESDASHIPRPVARDSVSTYRNLADAHYALGNYEKALNYYSLELSSMRLGSRSAKAEAEALGCTSLALAHLQEHQRALQSAIEALQLVEELADDEAIMLATSVLGQCYWLQGDVVSAERCHRRELALALQVGAAADKAKAYSNLGRVLRAMLRASP